MPWKGPPDLKAAPELPTFWGMGPHRASAYLASLSETLWYERRLLEYLLFKLVSANLVLASDDRRFVTPAIAEVEKVLEEVRVVELERDRAVAALAADWGVPASRLSLAYLAEHGPPETRATFADHRAHFMELVGEIEVLTRENRRLATVGLDGIRSTLGTLGGAGETATGYDAAGRKRTIPRAMPNRVDEVL